jgi:S1/P1 nuclease
MTRKLFAALVVVTLLSQPLSAWNGTGHQLVARIAWDTMTPAARKNVIVLLQAAPKDACLLDLFPTDARPLDVRQREFFMQVSTWPDIVRPRDETDTRPCLRFHRGEWHFINYFWEGNSGDPQHPPTDRPDLHTPEVTIVERLKVLQPFVACEGPACGTTREERAVMLAWILHMAGDIQQPLHSSSRITTSPDERQGDQGGNLFLLQTAPDVLRLHGYWDGIINRGIPQLQNENRVSYLDRVVARIVKTRPLSAMTSRVSPGQYEVWSREGFATTKRAAYPSTLRRNQLPDSAYQATVLAIAEEAIALGGYRLADLMNRMFGS